MRLSFLILLAACEPTKTPSDTSSEDTAILAETGDSPEDTSDSTTDTDTGEVPYTPTIRWSAVLVSDDAFQDIQPGDPGTFYVSSARAEGQTGALWRLDDSTADLADAPMWTGTRRRSGFGIGVSSFELPDVGRAVATAEYSVEAGYAGRLLVALDDGATTGGVMADDAVIDITGSISGDGYSGGFFGFGSALWGDDLYVSQTNAEPAIYSGTAGIGMAFADMASVEGVDADPYPDGGQGFVASQVRSTGEGLLVCSAGEVCQHLGDLGADWYLYDGTVYEGQADLSELDRDVSVDVFATVLYGYYVVTVIGDDPADRYVLVLNDDGEIVKGDMSGQYISVAAGETSDGVFWTAWGAFAYEADTPDETGMVYLVAVDADGEATDALIHLPLESPYTCEPRLVSDERSTLAVMCYEGDYVMLGQVE